MKNKNLLWIGWAWASFYACSNDPAGFVSDKETRITGNMCKLNSMPASMPSADVVSSLPAGSQILLNASGNLQVASQIFTYSGTQWTTEIPPQWSDATGTTDVVALYPYHETYASDSIYRNGELQDILFVRETFSPQPEIKLQFKHLFSFLTFRISPKLQSELQEITLTSPVLIHSVTPHTAELALKDTPHTVARTGNGSEYYSFVIPPAKDLPLRLSIKTAQGVTTQTLAPQTFSANTQYLCHVKTQDEASGIRTADDFIAFCKLINKDKSYTGDKTLEDFGETTNGVTTYRLHADISLNGAEIRTMGSASQRFKDVFDGQGHSITHFTVVPYMGECGLFGITDTSFVVKDLCIENASLNAGTSSTAGILAGNNHGLLLNCTVKNSTVKVSQSTQAGVLAGASYGNIINCSVQSCNMSGGSCSGIASGRLRGKIINSFFADNYLSGFNEYGGGICGQGSTERSAIVNCYTNCDSPATSSFGAIIGKPSNTHAENCFYDWKGKFSSFGKDEGSKKEVYSYGQKEEFVTNIGGYPILDKLNEWIRNAGSLYPHPLNAWQAGSSTAIPAVFVEVD